VFKFKINSKVIELDESLGEINNKARFMIPNGFIDCISHYRSPNEADVSVAGTQKSNLYTKLSLNNRILVNPSRFSRAITNGPSTSNFRDQELLYYALYMKKDVTPGALIKVTTGRGSKVVFFKVKKSGLIR
jgi:hypothetical protein